jgi:capsular exopolysaccharide synthesis family protein
MIDLPSSSQPVGESSLVEGASHDARHGETLVGVLWRFRLVLAAFVVCGGLVGHWWNRQKRTTYRATTKLMFRSDTPLSLDSATGAVRGGIPSGNLVQSLIQSDAIVGKVCEHPELRAIPELAELPDAQLISIVRSGVRFQPVTDLKDSRERMIATLSFVGHDRRTCIAAVNAVSDAIDQHFKQERQATINEFGNLISNAQNKLLPQQAELEQQYQRFREQAPLEWDAKGRVINPHRAKQFELQTFRDELERRHHELESELRFVTSMLEHNDDPLLIAQVLGHLSQMGRGLPLKPQADDVPRSLTDDLELKRIEVEKQLVPLEIRREQLENTYGPSHPQVVAIKTQIESSQRKLNQLNAQSTRRRGELHGLQPPPVDRAAARLAKGRHAMQIITAFVRGVRERLRVTETEIAELNRRIAMEKDAADELKKMEEKDASYRRQIEGIQGMLIQLEQQMSALNLADVNGGIIVEPLLHSATAQVTGPNLKNDLAVFSMLGFGIGVFAALVLEWSAKTFRSADDVQRELRLPVLTHIPVDEGGRRKPTDVVDPALSRLDPKLSVLHRPYSPAAEAIRGLRTAMLLEHRQHGSRVFQITSPLPGDGKSTIVANVGCSIAQSGKRALLIDLDLRSPRLSQRFNLQTETGLANALNGELSAEQAVHQTPVENLDILPCGPLPANPAEALTLSELAEIIQWARENYEFVIIDTPPLLMVSDPTIVSTHVDAAVMVMRIGRRCKPNAKEAVAMVRWSGTRLMGVVVNKIQPNRSALSYQCSASGSYQSIGYGYGDRYRRRYQQEVNARDTYVIKGRETTGRVDAGGQATAVAEPHVVRNAGDSRTGSTRPKRWHRDH